MITQFLGNNGDVDGSIARSCSGPTELGATDSQLGRLRAIMEATVGQLRGEANGILLSQWDADPTLNSQLYRCTPTASSTPYATGRTSVPTSKSRCSSVWPTPLVPGRAWNVHGSSHEPAHRAVGNRRGRHRLERHGPAPEHRGHSPEPRSRPGRHGDAGHRLAGVDEGPIDIREVEPDEIIDRTASDWEIDEVDETLYEERSGGVYLQFNGFRNILFEIEFQGSAHDIPFESR
jgi:hypothetical protein